MTSCFYNTPEARGLRIRNSLLGLSAQRSALVIDRGRTSVDKSPFTGEELTAFLELTRYYSDEKVAASNISLLYSDEFISKIGNWLNGESTLVDKQGFPKLVWRFENYDGSEPKYYNSVLEAIIGDLYDGLKYAENPYEIEYDIQALKNPNLNANTTLSILKKYWNYIGKSKLIPAYIEPYTTINNGALAYIAESENIIELKPYYGGTYNTLQEIASELPLQEYIEREASRVIDVVGSTLYYPDIVTYTNLDKQLSTKNLKGSDDKREARSRGWYQFKSDNPYFLDILKGDNNLSKLFIRHALIFASNKYNEKNEKGLLKLGDSGIWEQAFIYAKGIVELMTKNPITSIYRAELLQNPLFNKYLKGLGISPSLYFDKEFHQNRISELFGTDPSLSSQEVLQRLISIQSPLSKVAEHLLLSGVNIPIELQDELVNIGTTENPELRGAAFFPNSDGGVIKLSRKAYTYPDSTVLHEIIHAISYRALRENSDLANRASKIFKQAQSLFFLKYAINSVEELQERVNNGEFRRIFYGFTSVDEFYSELWTNSEFIKELNTLGTKLKPVWERLKEFLLNIIQIDKTSDIYNKASDILEELILNYDLKLASDLELYGLPLGSLLDDSFKLKDFLYAVTGSNDLFSRLPESKPEIKKLVSKFFQRETELEHFGYTFGKVYDLNGNIDYRAMIKDPSVLYTPITEEIALNYIPIQNVQHKPAEIIIPKLHSEEFYLGSHTLSEINIDYFKSKPTYYNRSVYNTDLLIRSHTGKLHVAFRPKLTEDYNNIYGSPVTVKTEDGWRISEDGRKLYKIPENSILYRNSDGDETLVIQHDSTSKKAISSLNILLNSYSDLVSILPFLDNINDLQIAKDLIDISSDKSVFSVIDYDLYQISKLDNVKDIKNTLNELYENKQKKSQYRNKLARSLYYSFIKALPVISSRIPTQALASFMNMVPVAYNYGLGNDVFVSRWQMMFLGSDLDIDKAFILGFGVNKQGMFDLWSSLASLETEALSNISLELPLPNRVKLVFGNKASDYKDNSIFIQAGENPELDNLVSIYLNAVGYTERLQAIIPILNYINRTNDFTVSESLINNNGFEYLVKQINKHNSSTLSNEAIRNYTVTQLQKICGDIRHIQSALSPIDEALDRIKVEIAKLPGRDSASAYDGKSIYLLQEDNLTGKAVVGIMANAIKAFFSMTQYFNKYYADHKDLSIADNTFFVNKLHLNGKEYNIATIANATLEQTQIHLLATILAQVAGVNSFLTTDDDVSIILSSLVSLATDNAKELALSKMHASLNLASMHGYLAMFGVPTADIIKYTTSPLFTRLYELTQANAYEGLSGQINRKIWEQLLNDSRFSQEFTELDVLDLKNLYDLALELRTLTSLLSINQGVKSNIADTLGFVQSFKTIYNNQFGKLRKTESERDIIESILKIHGLEPTDTLLNFYSLKINLVRQLAQKYGEDIWDIKINMNKYFTDPEYLNYIVLAYDLIKGTVNVFSVINSLPHFYEMIRAFNTIIQRLLVSAKAEFILNSDDYFKPFEINNREKVEYYDEETGEQYTENRLLFKVDYNYSDFVISLLLRFYDDYVLSDYVKNVVPELFSLSYTRNPDENILNKINIDFRNEGSINDFKQLTFDLLSKLKQLYPDNKFLSSLIPVNVNVGQDQAADYRYRLNFNLDTLNSQNSEYDQLRYNQIVGGFNDVMDLKIKDILNNVQGTDSSVGDILYLYNTIFNKDSFGLNSLTRLFGKYITNKNSLPIAKFKLEQEYELRQKEIITDSNLVNYFIFKNRIPKRLNGEMIINGITIKNDSPLQNMETVKNVSDSYIAQELFINALKSGLLEINIGDC